MLTRCGRGVLPLLQRAASTQIDTGRDALLAIIARIEILTALADDHINSVDFNRVQRHWLQLHTDCALLRSSLDTIISSDIDCGQHRKRWLKAVQRLDRAIIISGAIGAHRLEWIQSCVRQIQFRLRNPSIRKKQQADKPANAEGAISASHKPPIFSNRSLIVLPQPPTLEEYRTSACQQPFILRDGLSLGVCTPRWPALDRWASLEYLLSAVGEGRVVPVEVGHAYDSSNWTQAIVPFREFLHRIGYSTDIDPDETALIPTTFDGPWYLAQHDLFRQFPSLEADLALPDYVWSSPPGTESSSLEEPAINVWLGPGHGAVMTPAHTVG